MRAVVDITPEFFCSGMTIAEYIQQMTKNRELFEENYRNFVFTEKEEVSLRAANPAHVLVVTEDWCGDAIRYLPVLAHMAETAAAWDVRIFYRDKHPELSGRWLKHGKRSAIPMFDFLDEAWNEYACFVEKPEPVYEEELAARAAFASAHPDLADAGLPADEMSLSTRDIFALCMRSFRQENTGRWQHLFATELTERLLAASSQAVGAGCW